MNESRPKKNCYACDHQELQTIKECPPVLALVDEVEKLRIRLKECRYENNRLKGGLDAAKKMMHKGSEYPNFRTFRNFGPEMGWKAKTDAVLQFSRQIQECQEELRQLEEEKAAALYAEENARKQSYVEKRPFWRIELERRQARGEGAVVDPVTKECNEMRTTLESEKSRFKKLNREVRLLRNELQRKKDWNGDEQGHKKTYEGMADQLLDIQSEVSHIRLSWAEVKAQNEILAKEISKYRNKIKAVQEKSKANNALINDLTGRHKDTQKMIDSRMCIVQRNADKHDDDLREVDNVFVELNMIYEYIQRLTCEKVNLVRDLEILFPADSLSEKEGSTARKSILISEKVQSEQPKSVHVLSEENEESADNEVRDSDGTEATESADIEAQESGNNLKLEKLMSQCEKFRSLTDALQTEIDRWVYIISLQEERMNELSQKVVETKKMVFQKTEYMNKEKRMRSKKLHISKEQQETSNIRIKVKALRDENEYLRYFLKYEMEWKVKDMKIGKSWICDSKSFFDDALVRYKDVSEIVRLKKKSQPEKVEEESE